jgi:DNA-binding FrmR family transcriptional regulator
MKITNHIKERRKQSIDHLSRIQGQIETLKKYMEEDKNCADIAQLTTSIAKSFDSLRTKTLEGFIVNELLEKENISSSKMEKLIRVLNLYKK